VRDADSADDELDRLLRDKRPEGPPAAGLLFSCNGRGTRMFPAPHHDARATDTAYPRLPVAGFFAAGEIGAVGGKPFLHGHTASIALLLPEEERQEV
ncbi:MAG: FIST C-terminal domain-containing protein, partial [Armatimonadetes bacterium]|nr:FIST C-terminal domain-containing protein [Armatimonadota bacterium]